MKKKGQLGTLQNVVLSVVVIGFLIAFGILMLGKLGTTATNMGDTDAANATGEIKQEVQGITDYIGLIILAFIMIIVLGAIYLVARNRAQ